MKVFQETKSKQNKIKKFLNVHIVVEHWMVDLIDTSTIVIV